MQKFVIIDGNSLLFRAYFAMREMVTKDGIYTQGIFAFITMLNKILKDYEPDYIAVAFDMKGKTFRHEAYPEYKAGRLKTPPELLSQIPLMHDVLRAMNIQILEKESYEADDMIGTATKFASGRGIESLVITGDKDELQLIDEKTRVIINRKGMTEFDVYDQDAMKERYGLTPAQFVDLKGLMGDSSDNIPGIVGVGEKRGITLLKKYDSVEGVIEHADEIKGKLGENVRNGIESARMSKWLATINRDVPVDLNMEQMKYEAPDYETLREIYKKLEFKRFLSDLDAEASEESAESGASIGIRLPEAVPVNAFFDQVEPESAVVISLESDNSHIAVPTVSSVRLYSPDRNLYTECRTETQDVAQSILCTIAENAYQLYGMGLKEIVYNMMYCGIQEFHLAHDIEIAEYLLDPNRSRYMEDTMYLGYMNERLDMDDPVQTTAAVYPIALEQRNRLKKQGMMDLFSKCEMPLIETIAAMEKDGIAVDADVLREAGETLDASIQGLEDQITGEAGKEFNINSPKQLGQVLFEDLAIPYPKRSKGKSGYSTAADVLEKIRDEYPIAGHILEYRKASKLKSTYIDGLLPLIGTDGKIHPHFNQTVAATGRLSCTEPNLQNIPVRDEYGRNIRKAFVVTNESRTFVGSDYSQIELRIMAALSEDPVMIQAFKDNVDIHRLTASRIFNIPLEEVTPLDRSRAKAVNFGVIYGISGFGLSENLGITRKDAQKYIDEYFEKHTAVKAYQDRQIEAGSRDREVRTIFGRIRPIPEFGSRRYMDVQLAHRLAMNSPIQGTAADIIKIAMNKVYQELKERKMHSRLVLQIHDELIVEAFEDELDDVRELLTRNMEQAVTLSVPLTCDVNTGKTWYDLK